MLAALPAPAPSKPAPAPAPAPSAPAASAATTTRILALMKKDPPAPPSAYERAKEHLASEVARYKVAYEEQERRAAEAKRFAQADVEKAARAQAAYYAAIMAAIKAGVEVTAPAPAAAKPSAQGR